MITVGIVLRISVSTKNNPSAAVGKDAGEIKCEEMSEFENFDDFMDVTEPTLKDWFCYYWFS